MIPCCVLWLEKHPYRLYRIFLGIFYVLRLIFWYLKSRQDICCWPISHYQSLRNPCQRGFKWIPWLYHFWRPKRSRICFGQFFRFLHLYIACWFRGCFNKGLHPLQSNKKQSCPRLLRYSCQGVLSFWGHGRWWWICYRFLPLL